MTIENDKINYTVNPFIEYWYQLWTLWAETLFEVRALRNCHNLNVTRIDKIEKILNSEGRQYGKS